MRAVPAGVGKRSLFTLTVIVLGSCAFSVSAADPVKPEKPASSKAPLKTIQFEMRDKPWASVLEWFADQSGLAFSGVVKPLGTFNFISPLKDKRYTIPEIVDILNESMLSGPPNQKFILIRRSATFTLVPADEKIDPVMLQRVNVETSIRSASPNRCRSSWICIRCLPTRSRWK